MEKKKTTKNRVRRTYIKTDRQTPDTNQALDMAGQTNKEGKKVVFS
jgi:hypothetical protein